MNRRVKILNVTILCFWFYVGSFVNAQQTDNTFYHLTKDGLSSNHVNKVIQDREGFYWIATDNGLNRFDGIACKDLKYSKNDSTLLSHNNCLNLLEDDTGNIWIATQRSINRYLMKEGRFERYYLSHPKLSFAQAIVNNGKGNIWVGGAGLWQYNIYTRQWTRYLNDTVNKASLPAGTYSSLQYGKSNNGL